MSMHRVLIEILSIMCLSLVNQDPCPWKYNATNIHLVHLYVAIETYERTEYVKRKVSITHTDADTVVFLLRLLT